jgi:thiamine transporter ThiT
MNNQSINRAAHLITLVLLVILSGIVFYGIFAFVTLSFNPSNWSTEVRILYIVANIICYLIIVSGIRSQYKKSLKKTEVTDAE